MPRGQAIRRKRRPGSGFPTGWGTGDGHLEAHHDLQARPARPGKATRLGVRGSIVPAAPRTSSSFLKARGRDLLSATEKNGADFTRHNLTMHPIPMICAYNALLDLCSRKLSRQQQRRFAPGLPFLSLLLSRRGNHVRISRSGEKVGQLLYPFSKI